MTGLVAYLMGRGRFNEHTDQRVVAAWDGAPHLHQPPRRADGSVSVADLAAALAAPAVAAGVPLREPLREPQRGPEHRGGVVCRAGRYGIARCATTPTIGC